MSYLLKLGVLDGGFDGLLDALLMDKLLAELFEVTAEILSLIVPDALLLLVLPISKTVT